MLAVEREGQKEHTLALTQRRHPGELNQQIAFTCLKMCEQMLVSLQIHEEKRTCAIYADTVGQLCHYVTLTLKHGSFFGDWIKQEG